MNAGLRGLRVEGEKGGHMIALDHKRLTPFLFSKKVRWREKEHNKQIEVKGKGREELWSICISEGNGWEEEREGRRQKETTRYVYEKGKKETSRAHIHPKSFFGFSFAVFTPLLSPSPFASPSTFTKVFPCIVFIPSLAAAPCSRSPNWRLRLLRSPLRKRKWSVESWDWHLVKRSTLLVGRGSERRESEKKNSYLSRRWM